MQIKNLSHEDKDIPFSRSKKGEIMKTRTKVLKDKRNRNDLVLRTEFSSSSQHAMGFHGSQSSRGHDYNNITQDPSQT